MNPGRSSFSKRLGLQPVEKPITIRHGAPEDLRYCVLQIAKQQCGLSPSDLRDIVCAILRQRPNPDNWSPYPNIWNETERLLQAADWFRVYETVEVIYLKLRERRGVQIPRRFGGSSMCPHEVFEEEINQLYRELGVGWSLVNGIHESRGDDSFDATLADARSALANAKLTTSTAEMEEAIRDLSRRPDPDLSGAVHHSWAALEAVARQVSGDSKSTLGSIIESHKELFPKPLDQCAAKAWGYASEHARHGREERNLTFAEAQLMVGLSAVLIRYLIEALPPAPVA